MNTLIKKLQDLAAKEKWSESEDFNPADNGNYDDAYEGGTTDGEIQLARDILEDMKKLNIKELMNETFPKKA